MTMTNIPVIEPNGKLTAWLDDHDSHGIYDLDKLAADFKEKVGVPFPPYVTRRTVRQVELMIRRDPRGGTMKPGAQPEELTVSGYEMADAFAARLVDHHSRMMGRGFWGEDSLFRDCIAALKKGGY